MTLEEFYKIVMTKLPLFEQDYREKRKQAPNPNISHPLSNVQHEWFKDFEIWLHVQEAEKTLVTTNQKKGKLEQEAKENSVEFNLESFE